MTDDDLVARVIKPGISPGEPLLPRSVTARIKHKLALESERAVARPQAKWTDPEAARTAYADRYRHTYGAEPPPHINDPVPDSYVAETPAEAADDGQQLDLLP